MSAAVQLDPRPLRVAGDARGLQQAARELFEKEFHAANDEAVRASVAGAANRDEVLAKLPQRTTMPDGYYLRVNYLLELDAMLQGGLQISTREMTRDEFAGLTAVRNGRTEFENQHPHCGACGERNERLAMSCRKCGAEKQTRR